MSRRLKEAKQSRGLSLIEVLAVMVIAGVLVSIAVPNVTSMLDGADDKADRANIELIEGAVRQFRLDTGVIPADLTHLLRNPAGGIPGWDGPYLGEIPPSPSGKTYILDPNSGRVRCS